MLRCVDHAILAAGALDAAANDYEQLLGFAVSAGGRHPGAGTHNRLIVLDPEYVEIIARLPATPLGPMSPVTPMFARAPGPIGFALGSDNIDADVAAIRARGVTVSGPFDGRLDGATGTRRGWRTARIDSADLGIEPWRLPFLIQHDSEGSERLRHIAAPDGPRRHPIGALRLDHVTVAMRDLDAAIRAYALAFGMEPDDIGENPLLHARTAGLPLAHGAVVLAAPLPGDSPIARSIREHGEGLFSISVAVADLPAAVALLRARGTAVQVDEHGGILTAARPDLSAAHGARIELVRNSGAVR